ncbi:HAMP domain-containing histidine kinase [candidate division KSB1 bacterium]|nr:HAMP domain-containing histidine kinase [candidate division KSB1 bacterium]
MMRLPRLAYQHVGTFKGFLFLAAVILIISVLAYTQVLVSKLKDSTRHGLEQKIRMYSVLVNSESPDLIALALEQIQAVDFPIIVTDSRGSPKHWKNIEIDPNDTTAEARSQARDLARTMDEQGNPALPILVSGNQVDWFHYGDSVVIRQLRWLPWVEILVALLFVIIGYVGFSSIRRSEERMVWVGLAKETAHQLGTPLTSLMGWTELLKGGGDVQHAVVEMERDMVRLERVTARFSQIGSEPVMTATRLRDVVQETVNYFQSRLPRTDKPISLQIDFPCDPVVNLNRGLFGWVLENLIKNSIDALRQSGGEIQVSCELHGDTVNIDVADNGPGIQAKHRRLVFRPGFTTKTRGWGLGLSLARRIVEEYHGGRLFIKETSHGRGTVMRICLRVGHGDS